MFKAFKLWRQKRILINLLKTKITNIECLIEHCDAYDNLPAIDHIKLLNKIDDLYSQIKVIKAK